MSNLLSDERLVRRAAGGEERAFAAIFDRYHQPLYRYCAAIVGDSQDAQDALQNTMLKVLGALPGETREIKLKPWLYRIAHNESIDLLRRRRDTHEIGAELAAPGPPLAEELSARDRLRQLLTDLDELPERQRGALVMRELAGLDFDGIATALGTSPAVARQTLYEARLSLHQMDEGRGMDCATVTQALSDGDGRVTRRRDVRAHLRSCPDCRRFRAEIDAREQSFAALAPLPAAAAAGLLHGLIGGGAAGGSSSATGAVVAGGAAKALGSSAALKGAAAVLAIAAVGAGVADRGGLIDLGLPGGSDSTAQPSQQQPSSSHATSTAPPAETKHAAKEAPGAGPRSGGTTHSTDANDFAPQQPTAKPTAGEAEPVTHHAFAPPTSAAAPPAAGHNSHGTAAGQGSQGKASEHPHGKGHEKQLPAAASHGQETAAAHKNAEHGASGEPPGQAAKPAHPAHPEHPAHPSNGKEKGAAGESESESPEGSTTTEETSPQRGVGKKP
jgi:RNA polymerase sigma factor (sigma-70 family)